MYAQRLLQNTSKFRSLAVHLNRINGARQALPLAAVQRQQIACISTSDKKRDTTVTVDQTQTKAPAPTTAEDFANPDKRNYQSYGFVPDDQDMDINIRNYTMFTMITIGIVGMGFIMTYAPDHRMKDWNQREAYIQLARREALGLPLVDPDLVPRNTIELPSDEELGDYDIII